MIVEDDAAVHLSSEPATVASQTIGVTLVLMLIRLYQRTISRMLPPSCRFYPSCSEYAWQAVQRYGVRRGGWMAARRLARCHPFHPGGYDPVR